MKKTAFITFGIIMSTLVFSCGEDRRCVDANGNVVEDSKCEETEKSRSSGGHAGGYHWYYGGSGHGLGARVSGGSYSPVSRGGFGHSAAAHGSAHG